MKFFVPLPIDGPDVEKRSIYGYMDSQLMGENPFAFLVHGLNERRRYSMPEDAYTDPTEAETLALIKSEIEEVAVNLPKTEEEFGAAFGAQPCIERDTNIDARLIYKWSQETEEEVAEEVDPDDGDTPKS
jgi:hypothetical protein